MSGSEVYSSPLKVGRAILEAHGQWETENNQRGGQDLWGEQHVILLGQAAMLAASTPVGGWEDVAGTGAFLLDRLADFERTVESESGDASVNDWHGHVVPAISRFRSALSAPPPPSVSIDNGSRPQEAVPTGETARALANLDPADFRRRYNECREWSGSAWLAGEKITADERKRLQSEMYSWMCRTGNWFDWWADMAEAVAQEATPQPADGCSSNEGADIECAACDGSGKIVEAATTTGANQHSACQRDCEDCDGSGRITLGTETT